MTLVAHIAGSIHFADGSNSVLWSVLGGSATGVLLPAFAAACTSSWMDDARRPNARRAVIAVLALTAVCVLGDVVFGSASYSGGDKAAQLVQDAASLLLVAGGITVVGGLVPVRDEH